MPRHTADVIISHTSNTSIKYEETVVLILTTYFDTLVMLFRQ